MSIDIKYDNDVGVTFTLYDKFSYPEIENACKELFYSERFKKIKYWIIDRTQSIKYDLTTPQARTLAQLCISASSKNKGLTHIIVSRTNLEYGMANMFQVFTDETQWIFRSFKEIGSVHQWVKENINP